MQASSLKWKHFLYTIGDWLIPRPEDQRLLMKFQPVPHGPNGDWTDNFLTLRLMLRSGTSKVIGGRA